MSRSGSTCSALTLKKWLPVENEEVLKCFADCAKVRREASIFADEIAILLQDNALVNHHLRRNNTLDCEELTKKLEGILIELENLRKNYEICYDCLWKYGKSLLDVKIQMWKETLTLYKQKVTFYLQDLIGKIAHFYIYYGATILTLTFRISNEFNALLNCDFKYNLTDAILMTNNTCSPLQHPQRKISITKLLQLLALNRAELCAHKLIDCLLETYKSYEAHSTNRDADGDDSESNSSLEIYKALTHHINDEDLQDFTDLQKAVKVDKVLDVEEAIAREILSYHNDHFKNLDKMIEYEEQNVVDLLQVAIEAAPNMLGHDGIKKPKNGDGETRINPKALQKVLDYYQEILWGEVGNFLEHIILWWGPSPLASRVPHSSQHLREWITQFTPTAQIPPFIISTLTTLADGLGVHVTTTSWDRHFRLALVHSKTRNDPQTGQLFGEMLQDLVHLCNQCEVTNEWVVGAPLEELPLVEQIPVLHRLDHSVHTTRLWAASETKKLANSWNVASFFRITHCDIVNCLGQLSNVRMVDHALTIEKGGLDVHVEVCSKMRAKLVSEVQTNILKLKETSKECVECLAAVCTTTSLAHLQMIFPKPGYYSKGGGDIPSKHSEYVHKYLEQILTPVLRATEDVVICNMIMQLMCEAWLDHIYKQRVRFSHHGALQLLNDFGGVGEWLTQNKDVNDHLRLLMMKNEVLRRCEGVGRLLLRNPGEKIKMAEKHKDAGYASPKNESKELMPAEMYVPNQEQWLELRAGKKRFLMIHPLCCS